MARSTDARRPRRAIRAVTARYDARDRRVMLTLTNGVLFGIPLERLVEIAGAPDAMLREVELLGAGNVLHWERLDADYSVPALLVDAIGREHAAREFARKGGRSTTEAKAAAARANGAKGGRPRKRSAD